MKPPDSDFAVIYLANDRTIDWLIASYNSLRKTGYQGQCMLIQWNDDFKKVRQWCQENGIHEISAPKLLKNEGELKSVADQVAANSNDSNHLKKFHAFGQSDTFLYVDTDTIFLKNPAECDSVFRQSSVEFVYYNTDYSWVWVDPDFKLEMIAQYNSAGFNTGVFWSRRDTITAEMLEKCAVEFQKIKHLTAATRGVGEQSFINYVVDVCRIKKRPAKNFFPTMTGGIWANNKQLGRIRRVNPEQFPIIHWAGFQLEPGAPYIRDLLEYRVEKLNVLSRVIYVFKFYRLHSWTWRRILKAELRWILERLKH